jgi:hypothetical protein
MIFIGIIDTDVNMRCLAVDLIHKTNLVVTFANVGLVDTNGVDPDSSV